MSRYSRELVMPGRCSTRMPVLVRAARSWSMSKTSEPENARTSVGEKMMSEPR